METKEFKRFDLTKLTKRVIVVTFILAVMYLANNILIPVAFGMFLALLLYPICEFFEKKLHPIISIILAFLVVLIVFAGIGYFFGTQFYHLFENIKDFQQNIDKSIDKVVKIVNEKILQDNIRLKDIVQKEAGGIIGSSEIIKNTISISTGFIATVGLVFVYSFLFLLYRNSFKKLIIYHFPIRYKNYVSGVLKNMQKVAQNYFFGLFIIILIVGTLNGFGLWIIGLDYPFLFGYFAALLAIIPYIGTFIGGLLPFLYALINYDTIWKAVFVLLWYLFVQALEGNILTPKIVGSKVSLNPLIAIIALLTGGLIWGIAGMILFIPFMAILKVIFDNVEPMKPYGLLLSSDFSNKELPLLKRSPKKEKAKQENDIKKDTENKE